MSAKTTSNTSPDLGHVNSVDLLTKDGKENVGCNLPEDITTLNPIASKVEGNVEHPSQTEAKLPPAKKSAKDFVFGKLLGEGSFSSVYLAKDVKTGKEYAIKVCDKQHIIKERKTESIRREKDVLAILSANRSPTAPFFVHLYATFQDSQRLYFVMTFCHGGELLKYLNKFGSFEKKCCTFYTGEILQALRHLHRQGIVHRDLKPENILLNEKGHILVTDFGSAKVVNASKNDQSTINSAEESGRTRSNSFVGTAQYVSPEVLKGKYSEVGPPADLWALGCVLYQLTAGSPPFQAPNEFLIFQKILKLEYEFPEEFDSETRDLVRKLLALEPQERLGSTDNEPYISIQSHPFFKDTNLDTLCDETPPQMLPYSPTGDPPSSPLRSQHCIPDSFEPGFNPRVIAERVLRSDEDFPWECHQQQQQLSESSVDTPDSDSSHTASSPTSSRRENNNVSGEPPTTLMERLSVSQSGDGSKIKPMAEESRLSRTLIPIDSDDRQSRIREQLKSNPWHPVVKGNLILKQGLVSKRKGLFSRRRMMLLTEGPHLYYCEPSSMTIKGEIPWSASLKPEAKDFKNFFVHTPNRTYYLEDPEGYALEWCKAINEVRQRTYNSEENQP